MARATPSSRTRLGSRLRAVGLATLLVGAAPRIASGQSTIEGGRGTLLVPDADTVPATNFTTSLGAGYVATARAPFQLSPAAVTFGFTNRLDLGLGLRSWSPEDPEARGVRFDPRLSLKARVLTESPRRPALALALAADHAFQGWDLSPSFVVHKNYGSVLLAANAGWREPLHRDPADPAGPFFGVGAGWWATPSLSFFLHAVGEGGSNGRAWLMPGVAWSLLGPDPFEKRREALRLKAKEAVAALESELGARIETTPPAGAAAQGRDVGAALAGRAPVLAQPGRLSFFITGGPSLGAGPAWRIVAGIQISTFDEFLQDTDGDGIPDRVDQCPFEPEDWDGYEDEDGCPDGGTEVLRQRTLERLRAAAKGAATPTTPVPRFRLKIPPGEVPAPEGPRRETEPMHLPLDAPAPPASPAPPAGTTPQGGSSVKPMGEAKPITIADRKATASSPAVKAEAGAPAVRPIRTPHKATAAARLSVSPPGRAPVAAPQRRAPAAKPAGSIEDILRGLGREGASPDARQCLQEIEPWSAGEQPAMTLAPGPRLPRGPRRAP